MFELILLKRKNIAYGGKAINLGGVNDATRQMEIYDYLTEVNLASNFISTYRWDGQLFGNLNIGMFVGGENSISGKYRICDQINYSTMSITGASDLPFAKAYGISASTETVGYVLGGSPASAIMKYTYSSKSWSTFGSLSATDGDAGAGTSQFFIYTGNGTASRYKFIYANESVSSATTSLFTRKYGAAAGDNEAVVFTGAAAGYSSNTEKLIYATDVSSVGQNLTYTASISGYLAGTATATLGYFSGGYIGSSSGTKSTNLFNIKNNTTKSTSSMTIGRYRSRSVSTVPGWA